MPDAPVVAREVDLAAVPASITAVAISDDAEVLLLAAGNGAVFAAVAKGDLRLIGSFGHIPALAFLERSYDALLADDAENVVYLLRDAAASGELLRLAGEADGVAGPRAVASFHQGRRALVLNSASSELIVLNLAGGPPLRLGCDCVATGLHRLAGEGVFRLTEPAAGPVWLYDGDGLEPRLVVVPAAFGAVMP